MEHTTCFRFLVLLVCAALVGPAFAADAPKAAASTQTSGASTMGPQRSSQIVGMTVKNSQDQKLGKIDEFIIDADGRVKYAILSHGGILGIGDKLVPIPWKAIKQGNEKNTLMVNIDKATLEKAPNFDPKAWPDFTEPEWQKKLEVYYQLPAAETSR
jgi:hypothetical protein